MREKLGNRQKSYSDCVTSKMKCPFPSHCINRLPFWVGARWVLWQSISKKDSWGKKRISEGQLKEELVCENAWVWLPKIQRISEVRNEKELTANWESDSQAFNVPDMMAAYGYSWCCFYEWQQLVFKGGKEGIYCQSGLSLKWICLWALLRS